MPSVVTWMPTRSRTSSADPAGLLLDHVRLVLVGEEDRGAVDEVADQLAVAEGELLAGVGDERVAALAALLGVAEHPVGVVGADQHVVGLADAVDDRGRARSAGPRSSRRGRTRRSARRSGRWCTRTGRCGGCRRCARGSSRRRGARARSGSRRSPRRPRRPAPGRRPSWPRPKQMLAATPPRRISRSSTRKDSEILSSCSTTRESANLPWKRHQVVGGDGAGDQQRHDTGDYRAVLLGVPIGSP